MKVASMKDIVKGYDEGRWGISTIIIIITPVSILNKKWWPLRLSPQFLFIYFLFNLVLVCGGSKSQGLVVAL